MFRESDTNVKLVHFKGVELLKQTYSYSPIKEKQDSKMNLKYICISCHLKNTKPSSLGVTERGVDMNTEYESEISILNAKQFI